MKIRNICKAIVLSTALTTGTSCSKPKPFVEMPTEMIGKECKKVLDKARNMSRAGIDSTYEVFARDTIGYPEWAIKRGSNRLVEDLNQRAIQKADRMFENDSVPVDTLYVLEPRYGRILLLPGTKHVKRIDKEMHILKAGKYKNVRAVIEDKVLTRDSSTVCLPVKYMGVPNTNKELGPEAQKLKNKIEKTHYLDE
ncbi:MAG: hypothetical protein NC191_08655 [Muribaculaceae bacterium]|nr:hypothetical protein [Muribaculaceae bacterium]